MSLSVLLLCTVAFVAGCKEKAVAACPAGCTKPCCAKEGEAKACPAEGTKPCCAKEGEAKACPVDCDKPCCAKEGEAKACPEGCTKPCCAKEGEAKACPPDCDKPCCAEKKAEATEQTLCPVMNKPINKELFIEYEGQKVYFCCPGCVDTFKKDPAKYVKDLPQFQQ